MPYQESGCERKGAENGFGWRGGKDRMTTGQSPGHEHGTLRPQHPAIAHACPAIAHVYAARNHGLGYVVTSGIWMWDEPFKRVEKATGEEVWCACAPESAPPHAAASAR